MNKFIYLLFATVLFLQGCTASENDTNQKSKISQVDYFDNTGRDDVLSGGVKMIEISTPEGKFNVWTKRVGNNPKIKVLLLHGGPGASHEYLESFDSYFPSEGFEYYYYDQLGSYYSDQPSQSSLWSTERFVEEVEQVRKALNLTKDNFYLYGHSWGGILAVEYALKYQENLKGLIISNMMMSVPDYNKYAEEVLGPQLDPAVLAEIKAMEAKGDYENPRYLELITIHYYPKHFLRMPLGNWPDPVNRAFKHLNPEVYVPMQGPSEFGMAGNAKLKNWSRKSDLPHISVPALIVGAEYDTMDPKHMQWVASQVQRGRYLHCPNGSHMAMYDDQQIYFDGLSKFIRDVNEEKFK